MSKSDIPLPLTDPEIDTVTNFAHNLYLWASGRKRGTVDALVDEYSRIHDLLRKGNVDLEGTLTYTDVNATFRQPFIEARDEAKLQQSDRDRHVLKPEAMRRVLEGLAAKKAEYDRDPGQGASWQTIRGNVVKTMQMVISSDREMAAEQNDPHVAFYTDTLSDLLKYVRELKMPGRRAYEQDGLATPQGLRDLKDPAKVEHMHIAHDTTLYTPLGRLAAAITLDVVGGSEGARGFFKTWLENASDIPAADLFAAPRPTDVALDGVDRFLIERNIGENQRREINRDLRTMAIGMGAKIEAPLSP